MKKYLFIILFAIMPILSTAQTYNSLWKQYERSAGNDLPKDMLATLAQIESKAQLEKEYGQLLKAQLQMISTQSMISPDSIVDMMGRYEAKAAEAEKQNPVLGAVYATTIYKIYKYQSYQLDMKREEANAKADEYKEKAIKNPDLLASTKAKDFEPLALKGISSDIFNNDLLHVICFETEQFKFMHDYYTTHGNRPAACISGLYKKNQERFEDVKEIHKSKHLSTIDSLINVYRDLPEAGELAIEHFNFMEGATDASAAEKIEYIDYALLNWPSWPRMNVLKNAKARMTLPSFHAMVEETNVLPGVKIPVHITSLKNLHDLKMTVSKVNITGADKFNPNNLNDYKILKSKVEKEPVFSDHRSYYGLPDYMEVRDTITIKPLPVGVYMLEFTTDNSDVAVERTLIHVSNLRLIDMDLPGNEKRLITVDATTGKPMPHTQIRMKYQDWKNGKNQRDERTFETDDDGEITMTSTLSPREYLLTNGDDKAFTWQYISRNYWNLPEIDDKEEDPDEDWEQELAAFTDRSIYRPGQEVQVAAIAYLDSDEGQYKAKKGVKLEFTLVDDDGEEIDSKKSTTDEFGVASVAFTLPKNGRGGWYSVEIESTNDDENYDEYVGFRVEEYKRPTFDVTIDEYNEAYKEGDTITLKGHAKTFAGVPVQGAKVKYRTVSRTSSWWLRYFNDGSASDYTDYIEGTTAEDGSFEMKLPIKFATPKNGSRYRFHENGVEVTVTSLSGESHDAHRYLPLSDKATVLGIESFDEKLCRENLKPIRFTLVNNAGKPVEGEVTYTIDNANQQTVKANTSLYIDMNTIKSGEHTLNAVCGTDSIEKKFVLFSLEDKKTPVETPAWIYSTTGDNQTFTMKADKSEFVQLGTSLKNQIVYYAIATDTALLECGHFTMNDEILTREFKYKEEWGDGISCLYIWIRDGKQYSFSRSFMKPEVDRSLTLEWSTFRDKVIPGQKEEWTLNIKNPDGTPAKAAMMAVLYDQSLDMINPHNWNLNVGYTPYISSLRTHASFSINRASIYGEQTFKPLSEQSLDFTSLEVPTFGYNVYGHRRPLKVRGATSVYGAKMLKAAPMMEESATADALEGRVAGVAVQNANGASISGVVTDSSGEPIIGAIVMLMNDPNITAVTDFDGKFYILAKPGERLEISYIGMITKTVTATQNMTIMMQDDENALEECVVVGYGTQKKSLMTASVAIVESADYDIDLTAISTRENFNETAFFYPQLVTDKAGNISLKFTLPESLTTWKFMSLAHDKEMNYGYLYGTTIAQKQLMVQPNMPRFIREGDNAQISATISNLSDKQLNGTAALLIIDPATEKVLHQLKQTFQTKANGTTSVTFKLPELKENVYNVKIVAQAKNFSDGEQHQLPVLSNKVEVVTTRAFTQIEAGRHEVNIEELYGNNSEKESLTVEYTNNPAWLMIDAIPSVSTPDSENAISLSTALYTSSIANRLTEQLPEDTLLWKISANASPMELSAKLRELQYENGAFSWFKDMRPSAYITHIVVRDLARIKALRLDYNNTNGMLAKAMSYLDEDIAKYVIELKKIEKETKTLPIPSDFALDYLYIQALNGEKLNVKARQNAEYLLKLIEDVKLDFTIYGKARTAIILGSHPLKQNKEKANLMLESIRQYTVSTPEMGIYFDTPKAYYSWFDYRIPTQTAALEALQILAPEDTKTISGMQQWLLQEKRTQQWDTPINSASAIYVFFNGWDFKKTANTIVNETSEKKATKLVVDGKTISDEGIVKGTGYVNKTLDGRYKKFTAEKTSDNISWGAVYVKATQPMEDITDEGQYMTITREILDSEGKPFVENPAVGDKVKVRLTIMAQRDLDFVEVVDNRPACFEPVSQVSGYRYGYYVSPKDNKTTYYFDSMPKGKHVMETEYYIDRAGDYRSGLTTAKCTYAPEYQTREGAYEINTVIKK